MDNGTLNLKLAVCALARDCEDALPRNMERIEQLRRAFAYSEVCVVENDSKDRTKMILSEWSRRSVGVTIISNDYGSVTIPVSPTGDYLPQFTRYRIEKMCRYRNIYMEWLDVHSEVFDVVMVIDIDCFWFSVDSIVKALRNAPSDWGALTANGRLDWGLGSSYYDLYPLNIAGLDESVSRAGELEKRKELTALFKKTESDYIPVLSAFCGLALYRGDAVNGARYRVMKNNGKEMEVLCEHVSVCVEIDRRGHRVYIVRSMKLMILSRVDSAIRVVRGSLRKWLFELPFISNGYTKHIRPVLLKSSILERMLKL